MYIVRDELSVMVVALRNWININWIENMDDFKKMSLKTKDHDTPTQKKKKKLLVTTKLGWK